MDLPAEILTQIFELAINDPNLFDVSLPTCMTESHWEPDKMGDGWVLINPVDFAYQKPMKNYAATKSILLTCRRWYQIGSYLIFRCVFVQDPSRLPALCSALDRDSSLGWYVRRLHIMRYFATRHLAITDIESMLVSIVQQCPNLEIFAVDWPITSSFIPVADALCTFSNSLRTVQWSITSAILPRLIWALDSLPQLESIYLNFEPTADPSDCEDKTLCLGAASNLAIDLPSLHQLSLRGMCEEFLDQACEWTLASLRSFSLDFVANRHDLPDILAFLTAHGTQISFLDLNTIPSLDISTILDLCPLLTHFAFNPDWRLPFHTEANDPNANPKLIRSPHPHLTHIGLHQLLHAFSPSLPRAQAPSLAPVTTYLIQRTNDLTFAQLTRKNFPKLKVIRVLNRTLLRELERNDGPDEEGGGLDRWQRWDEQCRKERVRLEDCTGDLLGTLPMDEDEGDEYDSESDEESGEGERAMQPGNVQELRVLLEEVRRMNMGREEAMAPIFAPGLVTMI